MPDYFGLQLMIYVHILLCACSIIIIIHHIIKFKVYKSYSTTSIFIGCIILMACRLFSLIYLLVGFYSNLENLSTYALNMSLDIPTLFFLEVTTSLLFQWFDIYNFLLDPEKEIKRMESTKWDRTGLISTQIAIFIFFIVDIIMLTAHYSWGWLEGEGDIGENRFGWWTLTIRTLNGC